MTDIDKAPATLQGRLNRYKPNQAVKLVGELCAQLVGDSDSFHGGIWPGNIRLSSDKKAVLGAPSDAPVSLREADEVEFLAPEFFWDGSKSASADVYSLGLLLYAMCNRGRMPFQPRNKTLTDTDRSAALRRRMKGETVSVTGKFSAELKAVISKALSYDPEKRFISAAELLAALEETEEAKSSEGESAAPAAVTEEAAAPAEEISVPEELPAEVPAAEETPAEKVSEDTLSETPDAVEEPAELPQEEPSSETPATESDPAGVAEDAVTAPDIRRYTVQKDFEETVPYRRAASNASGRRKKRVSPIIPILAILAVGIILVVVLVMALGAVNDPVNDLPEGNISEPFTITPSEVESETEDSQPGASAEPEGTESEATQEESAETEEEPAQEHFGSSTVNGMDVEPVYDIVLVTESGAKLRTGPSTSYDVADSLPKNTELVRTGTVENWSQVQYNDGEYYIANTLITVSDTAPEAPEEEEENEPSATVSENTSGSIGSLVVKTEANIRAGAGTNYDKLGIAKVGTKLTVTDVTDDGKWYQVSYNGKTGYINRNMVTVEELEYSATATVKSDVNVRSGPGSEYTKLGVAKTGDKLTVTGVTGTNWYKISYNGKTGYVAGNYITIN